MQFMQQSTDLILYYHYQRDNWYIGYDQMIVAVI